MLAADFMKMDREKFKLFLKLTSLPHILGPTDWFSTVKKSIPKIHGKIVIMHRNIEFAHASELYLENLL
jgi:hypothetical protein